LVVRPVVGPDVGCELLPSLYSSLNMRFGCRKFGDQFWLALLSKATILSVPLICSTAAYRFKAQLLHNSRCLEAIETNACFSEKTNSPKLAG